VAIAPSNSPRRDCAKAIATSRAAWRQATTGLQLCEFINRAAERSIEVASSSRAASKLGEMRTGARAMSPLRSALDVAQHESER